MTQALQGTRPTLTHTMYVDGTATNVGSVTVTLTRQTGTAVATADPTTNNGDGTYTYQLPAAATLTVDHLTATWAVVATGETVTTSIEVVGGWLFTESQLRAFDHGLPESGYPDPVVIAARHAVTDDLQQWTGVSWVPRYGAWTGPSRATTTLRLPHRHITDLLTVTVNGTSEPTSDYLLDIPAGIVHRLTGPYPTPTTAQPLNVTVTYRHGYPHLRNGVDRIAMKEARDRIIPSNIIDRAARFTDELGTYDLVVAGLRRNVSSIPETNAWVQANNLHDMVG